MPNSQKGNILSECNGSKGFAPIILVVILVTLFIGGIVYFKSREPFEQQRLAPGSPTIPLEVKKRN